MDSGPPAVAVPGTGLRIRAKAPGARVPVIQRGSLILDAEPTWLLEGPQAEVRRAVEALGDFACALSADLAEVRFGNSVGCFWISPSALVEVRSGKWSSDDFDCMLNEVAAIAAALPFAAEAGGALPYDRSYAAHEDLLYHAFVYLRHVMRGEGPPETRLVPAIEVVLREPHRRHAPGSRTVRPENARGIRASELRAVVAGRRPLEYVGPIDNPLARALGGHLPGRVQDVVTRSTYDTPENRFVKAFLDVCDGIIGEMELVARVRCGARRVGRSFDQRIVDDCLEMRRVLDRLRREGRWLWEQVGPMVHLPIASTVLQRRRGYREILGHFVRLRLSSHLPLSGADARRLLEIKDIALLYEIWTFFKLVESATALHGRPSRAIAVRARDKREMKVPNGTVVEWPDGLRLEYNAAYSPRAGSERRSYSVDLRPDISVHVPSGPGAGLHLLDAKFKLDRLEDVMPQRDHEGARDDADTEERGGTFKRADLYKMHAYRDAIEGTRSAWVLYPGDVARFYGARDGCLVDGVPPEGAALDGVGALPVRPVANGTQELDRLVRALLAPLGSGVFEGAA